VGKEEELTSVHRTQHAGDEAIDTIALFDLRDQSRDTAFVICRTTEMSKDEFLERVDLILKSHQVADGLVSEERYQQI
jgi:hypothetical protein